MTIFTQVLGYHIVMATKTQQLELDESTTMNALLRNRGFEPIYGGGSKSKGHGFWIVGHKHAWTDRVNLNPSFFMLHDCRKLVQYINRAGECFTAIAFNAATGFTTLSDSKGEIHEVSPDALGWNYTPVTPDGLLVH